MLRNTPGLAGLRTSALSALALSCILFAQAAVAGPRICAFPTDGSPLPEHVKEARLRSDGPIETPGGYRALLERTLQNRRQLRDGIVSEREATDNGGLRITGTKDFPVFPFLYSNTGAAPFTQASLEDQLFTGPWPTGTMKEYYEEISYGLFSVDGMVDNWYTLANNDGYYEGVNNGLGADAELGELMTEILNARDGAINFGQYDNDGPDGVPNSGDDDGYVDFIAFITPDVGGECGATGGDNIWSHKWSISGWTGTYYETGDAASAAGVANIRINEYFIAAGQACAGGQNGMGVYCHEFGHALGIADLYDTNDGNGASSGIGHWGLMGAGNWNTPDHPSHMTAWSKERLGWLHYYNVTRDNQELCLPPVETHQVAARVWTDGDTTSAEYFVVENRQQIGFDVDLHAPGLVIYHIDDDTYDANDNSNSVNADETHKAIDVECADATSASHAANADDLDANVNRGDADDPWCPSTQVTFDGASVPDTRAYSGAATGVAVRNIDSCTGGATGEPGWICAEFEVGVTTTADLCMHDCSTDGCAEITNCSYWWGSPDLWIDNNDDGTDDYPADGVANHLWFRVENTSGDTLAGVDVELYYADPAMGQLWPSTGTLIDTYTIPVMNPGDIVEDYVVFNYPVAPPLVDHYCIGGVAVHSLDPQNSEYPPNDNNVAQVNHQVLVSRAGGMRSVGCPGLFERTSKIRLLPGDNPTGDGVYASVRLGTPPRFDDVQVPSHWNVTYNPGPFWVPNGGMDWQIEVQSPNAAHGETAHIPITLWDEQRQKPVGGVIQDYVIDCMNPKPVSGLTISCMDPVVDDLGGPNVKLDWDPVDFDVSGGAEAIKFYEVYRSDNMGGAEALVAQVAIDAEPSETDFQWYDEVWWTENHIYTYRIRAIDTANSASGFSSAVDVDCQSSTGVGELGGVVVAGTSVVPNPFNESATISYSITSAGSVALDVYDASGRKVRGLVHGQHVAGTHEIVWDGRDDSGMTVASGVYFYRVAGPDLSATKKLVLTR
ncbi:MAG: M6 family metalloprotease domain-containing protein [Gemmatimonadota bacterium]|jgi:M6 family metalloprotease-like protein|nr:M6 family metalloprotease domain-containing protein [Gemmatimonadota bacterium]MDP7031130.1 M6 family metalloprotease domain-containing protein [Gemmatimonadota bacterium]